MYHLVQPHLFLFLLTGLALVNLWRKRQESRRRLLLLTLPFVALAVLSTPALSYLALGSLEWPYPPLENKPDDVQAIVVLSGYVQASDSSEQHFEPGVDTLYRCVKAAELYHQGKPCPIVVSGGKINPDSSKPACAAVMRSFLLAMGVKPADLIVEDQSRSTYENAIATGKLLDERGIRNIILVTDAAHLSRALACFHKQGVPVVVPCGCRYRAQEAPSALGDFLPQPAAAGGVQEACYEWLGTTWYWLRKRT